jgi:hypothetical protein
MSSPTTGVDALTALRVIALPRLRQFVDSIEQTLTPDEESFFACEEVFRDLIRDEAFVRDLARYEVERLRGNPFYAFPRSTEWQMQVFTGARFQLVLRLVDGAASVDPETLPGLPQHVIIGVCGPGSVSCQHFVEELNGLARSGREALAAGATRAFRAGRDVAHLGTSLDFTVLLSLIHRQAQPTYRTFDYRTLEGVQLSASDPGTSRLEFATKLLAELDYTPASDAVAGLCEHPLHFVRWSAMRGLARLDPERALPLIEAAMEDPHPHVREAARKSLDRLSKEEVSWP